MRILDDNTKNRLDNVTLYLTMSEAKELRDSLDDVIMNPRAGYHAHVSNEDYQKEITVCLYDAANLEGFSERSKQLILKDK